MNKAAIKNFAIAARKKLISEITYKAGLVGITPKGIAEPVHKSDGIEMYDIGANEPYSIKDDEIKQRKGLVARVMAKGFDQVIEEVAYTWFNRIVAVRYMEINDYLPIRVRVLSSEMKGKAEPDIVTEAPNVDLGFKPDEIENILELKHDNKLDELFRMLFIKQCNALNEILPELFEKTADYTELLLSISFTNEDSIIRELVNSIDEGDFKEQVEIIGWLYQYYNTELKDDTFAKLKANVKITKERIPAATQLFTPDWIVRYMVENSLGRLWLEGHPDVDIKTNWKYYLDEAEQEPDVQVQLAQLSEERKNLKPEDIKVIDPCMGSGHILVYAFDVLMDIYKSSGYDEREAVKLILQYNLYGLDIDDRAYQLAYFAVMMKARGYSRRILSEGITPQLCAIQESKSISQELIAFVANNDEVLMKALQYIADLFKEAKEFGSILNVECGIEPIELLIKRIEDIKNADFSSDLIGLMYREETISNLYPIVKQTEIMMRKYDVVVTNPPYMGSGGMGKGLSDYVKKNYPDTKSDLSTVFMEKTLNMCRATGMMAMINIPVWMFLSSYRKLRENIIQDQVFINMLYFGRGVFGSDFGTTAFIIKNVDIKRYKAIYRKLYQKQGSVENIDKKEQYFFEGVGTHIAEKENFLNVPGIPIAFWASSNAVDAFKDNEKLNTIADIRSGISTGDNDRFYRLWFECNNNKISFDPQCTPFNSNFKWFSIIRAGEYRKWWGNRENVINLFNGCYEIKNSSNNFRLRTPEFYNMEGITWCRITIGNVGFRIKDGVVNFGENSPSMFVPLTHKEYLLGLLNTKVISYFLSFMNPTMTYQVIDIAGLPIVFSEDNISTVSTIVKSNITISKTDWDNFETSWDFKRHPFLKHYTLEEQPMRIETIFNIWETDTIEAFMQLKANEEELNRIFIKIYGLQDELTPDVEEKDVTIRSADLERDIKSFISYAVGCIFGRYSLNLDGLTYAGGEWDSSKYKTFLPDSNNIIYITDEEYFEDDIVCRFVEFVKVIFGTETLEQNIGFIAKTLGNKGNTSREMIRSYFIKDFYKDHVKIYQKRPIYWLFDSGKENGFKALIYMHRYTQDTVGKVRADYLHRTQKAIENSISRAYMIMESAANPTQKANAVKDKEKLVKQLAETKIYDAAIGHIAAQRIAIDLDDGVTVNYAKFQGVEISSEGKKASKIDLLGKI